MLTVLPQNDLLPRGGFALCYERLLARKPSGRRHRGRLGNRRSKARGSAVRLPRLTRSRPMARPVRHQQRLYRWRGPPERSEERRVGKEGRARWWPHAEKEKHRRKQRRYI